MNAAPEGAKKNGHQCEHQNLRSIATDGRHRNHQHSGLCVPPPLRRAQWHLCGTQQHHSTQNKAYDKYNKRNKGSIMVGFVLEEEQIQRREEHYIANGAPNILAAHLSSSLGGFTNCDHDCRVQKSQCSHGENVSNQANSRIAHEGILDTTGGLRINKNIIKYAYYLNKSYTHIGTLAVRKHTLFMVGIHHLAFDHGLAVAVILHVVLEVLHVVHLLFRNVALETLCKNIEIQIYKIKTKINKIFLNYLLTKWVLAPSFVVIVVLLLTDRWAHEGIHHHTSGVLSVGVAVLHHILAVLVSFG